MDVLFEILGQKEFMYILIAFAGATTISELRNKKGKKKKISTLIGSWGFTFVTVAAIFLIFYPFFQNHEYGITMLFGIDMMLGSLGGTKAHKIFFGYLNYIRRDNIMNDIVECLESLIKILKAGAKKDDTS